MDRSVVAAGMGRHRLERRRSATSSRRNAATPARRRSRRSVSRCARRCCVRFGTPAQQQRFLPRIYRGDDFWCQGYSEPGSGSDLASLRTSAVRRGDHYVVNGQKTWTTLAHMADWIFCLVRTGGDADAKKQEGISFLLIDLATPGITVRPLVLMDGGREVNEVYFDDVAVPVGPARPRRRDEAGPSRSSCSGTSGSTPRASESSKRELERLKAFAARQRKGGRPLIDDPRFRDRLSRLEIELIALTMTNLRFLDRFRGGNAPGRRSVDAEDQGHRDPAGAHRIDDAGSGAARAADRSATTAWTTTTV